ncbi:MAG: hypothetical protein U5R06_02295 [candidate division KSB1 bacterium]|nr:hypothetical protein [candidate division KSB1 bacterium]
MPDTNETIDKMAEQVQQIYDCLFGNPDNPLSGLYVHVDRNTRFRRTCIKILLILLPTVAGILVYIIKSHTNHF